MLVFGIVKDAAGLVIPGTSVTLVDTDGTYLGVGTTTDNMGYFEMNNEKITPDKKLFFTHIGYKPIKVSPRIDDEPIIAQMFIEPQELPQVIVTPGDKVPAELWILAVFALAKITKII